MKYLFTIVTTLFHGFLKSTDNFRITNINVITSVQLFRHEKIHPRFVQISTNNFLNIIHCILELLT